MDGSLFWRVALLQAAAVAVVAVALALALPKDFFEDWGWLVGGTAWFACALLMARVLNLAPQVAVLGAAVAGAVSVTTQILTEMHWLGTLLAVLVFAAWCSRRGERWVAWNSA